MVPAQYKWLSFNIQSGETQGWGRTESWPSNLSIALNTERGLEKGTLALAVIGSGLVGTFWCCPGNR